MAGARAATPRKVDQALAKERGTSQQGFRDRTGKQLPLNAPISALGSAGVAVALYFYTVWAMIFVFLGAFVINLPTLTHNWAAHPDKGWVMRLSLGPYSQLEPDDMISKQALPSMLVAFLFIGFLMWLDRKEASVATEVDRGFTTSGDFSVEVRNIPVGKSGEADLKSYFGKWGAVHSVIVAYKSSKFMLKRNEWEALNLERVEMQAALDLKEEGGSTDQAGREKLRAVRERLREVEQDMARMQTASKEATGVAFCVYDTEQSRFKCLDAHKRTFFRWLLHKVTFGCLGNNPKYLKSYELDVMAAPEPSDVNWQNLHYTRAEVSVRAFRTLVASMVLIGFSAAFFIEFDRWTQAEVEQLQKTKSHAEADQWGQVISIAVPVVVTLVNFALSYLIGRMTAYEHRYTKTDYEQSLFFKVALTIVINQSMLGLFVNPKPSDWWDNSGGAMTDALYNAISNFQPELQKFIQPELVVSRYMIARMAASQKRADRHWEPPETSLGEFYASATTIAALGIIYGPASARPAARRLAPRARARTPFPADAFPLAAARPWPSSAFSAAVLPDHGGRALRVVRVEQVHVPARLQEPPDAQLGTFRHLLELRRLCARVLARAPVGDVRHVRRRLGCCGGGRGQLPDRGARLLAHLHLCPDAVPARQGGRNRRHEGRQVFKGRGPRQVSRPRDATLALPRRSASHAACSPHPHASTRSSLRRAAPPAPILPPPPPTSSALAQLRVPADRSVAVL